MIHTGAVAVLDALGFKGIWKRWDPALVVARFQSIITETSDYTSRRFVGARAEDFVQHRRLQFLSDTIVVASAIEPTPGKVLTPVMHANCRFLALLDLCIAVAHLQRRFLLDSAAPPLAFRGAIAWGQFTIEGSLLIGPATDEAAEAEKLAEAAFAWFCPSALSLLSELDEEYQHWDFSLDPLPIHRDWPVPLKNGQRFVTAVVRPFGSTKDLTAALGRAFSGNGASAQERPGPVPIDVAVKLANTRAFLEGSTERNS